MDKHNCPKSIFTIYCHALGYTHFFFLKERKLQNQLKKKKYTRINENLIYYFSNL